MTQILTKQIELPKFNLHEPYSNDIWNITEWDYYKNSPRDYKRSWNSRSNVMNNRMDFTLCKNLVIREEAKYFCYLLIEDKKISLRTFAEYADRFKLLFTYINEGDYKTILDVDTDEYEIYIGKSHKIKTDNGSALIGNEIISIKKRNRLISFVDSFKKSINEFIESGKPIFERDYWRRSDVKPSEEINISGEKNIDFSQIIQPLMKYSAKKFVHFKLASLTFSGAYGYVNNIKLFCKWLYGYDKSIKSFAEVTRDIVEDYFCYLRVETDFSQRKINTAILNLSVMFEYGLLNGSDDFPSVPIFLSSDYAFKTTHMEKFYSSEEVAGIFSVIPYLPKVYGKVLLVLHHCGMRISEVLRLPMDCLYFSDGVPCLKLYMYKTERDHNIPLNNDIYNIIKKEIKRNKKKFPEAKYVFINKDGSLISYGTFIKKIKTVLLEHNVMGHDGKPLLFGTHRFRSTKATELISLGVEPQKAADILGIKSLSALSHYVSATQTSIDAHMQEYLRRESILINSIGKMDEFPLEDYENAVPLCNGWCCRPTELGLCDKINACLTCSQFRPSHKHLISYKLQLSEIESTLAVAKANNYTRIVEKCLSDKEALENIIKRLEEMLDDKKHEADGEL